MILKGKITKGFGRAKTFVTMMKKPFFEKYKLNLYPGTLNIKLENEYQLNIEHLITSEEYGGTFNVQVQKCKIFGQTAYIVRSEKNIKDKGDYKQDIIEIVSDINFREEYNLEDGDEIEIII